MAKKRGGIRKKKIRIPTAEDEPFLRDILANPEDDAPRLRYADWLEAHGDPDRAEFIRLDIYLARPVWQKPWEQDPEWSEKRERMLALRDAYREDWLASVPEKMRYYVFFVRGFPGGVSCNFRDFLWLDETVWQAAPVTKLVTTLLVSGVTSRADWEAFEYFRQTIDGDVKALAAAPQLAHIFHLGMAESGILTRHVKPLLASPYLSQLRSLYLSCNGFGDAAARAVAKSSRLPSLTCLDLGSNRIGDKGAVALAASPHLARLSELFLSQNAIGDEGGRAIAASPYLAGLRHLDLTQNALGEATRTALRERFGERVAM